MRDSIKLRLIGAALVIVLVFGWCWHRPGDVEKHSDICSYDELDIDGTRFFVMVSFSVLVSDQRKSIDLNKMAEVVIVSPNSQNLLATKKGTQIGDRIAFSHGGKSYEVEIVQYIYVNDMGTGNLNEMGTEDVQLGTKIFAKLRVIDSARDGPPDVKVNIDFPVAVGGQDSTLLVSSTRTGDAEIFLVNLSSDNARNLTRHIGEDTFPSWSRDKSQITFISNRNGSPNVYVMDADGNNVLQLTKEEGEKDFCSCPNWSPDGKKIVYCRFREASYAHIVVMDADGSNAKSIRRSGWDPAWSPDGNQIAFASWIGNGFKVCIMDADGANVKDFATNDNKLGYVYPAWSPDGKKIAYTDLDGGALEIHVCDADGSNIKKLTALGGVNEGVAWSPDGKTIAFQRHVGAASAFYLIDADGANTREVHALSDARAVARGNRPAWRSN